MAVGGHGRGKLDDHHERILIVALEGQRLAVSSPDFFHNQIGVQLDAHAAGGFHGLEIDFGGGGNRLSDSVKGGGDVVVLGKEIHGPGSLRVERRGSTRQEDQRNEEKCSGNSTAKGHRTPFDCLQFCTNVHL